MQREIRYCTSADGTRIAYSTYGERPGTPLVEFGAWYVTNGMCIRMASMRPWYEEFAKRWSLVTFDHRGTGDSQREVEDVALGAHVADLEAVIAATGIDRFHLMGHGHGGAVAVTYASQHPERIERLTLSYIPPRATGILAGPARDAFLQLVETDWPLAIRTFVDSTSWKYATFDVRRDAYRELSQTLSPRAMAQYLRFASDHDISSALPGIQAPTLVMQASAPRRVADGSRETASLIPNARFVQVREANDEAEVNAQIRLIVDFLGQPAVAAPDTGATDGMAVILFADIADSTALTERMGDERFRTAARALEAPVREAIARANGTVLDGKLLGDGVLAVFTSARQAIEAALQCARISDGGELRLHLGIHAGDVIREPGNVYGGAVNIASRISDASQPGEILVSATVRDLARTSAGVAFEDRGEHSLKGIADPVRVFAVQAQP
ncbi:MAG: adenylate/guanylate cyclase domain-containing protein [Dehalococcoidia bacterium]